MIVALTVAILMGTCKSCTSYFALGSVLEGADETLEEEEEEEEEDEVEGFFGGYFREGFKEGNLVKKNKKKAGKKKQGNKCDKRYAIKKKGGKCTETCKKNCDKNSKWSCYSDQKTCKKKETFVNQHNIPSSEPTSLNNNGDEAPGERIDYAATLEMAYDNLDKMLGKKGMQGLTQETGKLAKQQKGLMESLKNMAPIMQNAKSTLEQMNLPEINKMASMMQNINAGKRANK